MIFANLVLEKSHESTFPLIIMQPLHHVPFQIRQKRTFVLPQLYGGVVDGAAVAGDAVVVDGDVAGVAGAAVAVVTGAVVSVGGEAGVKVPFPLPDLYLMCNLALSFQHLLLS